MKKYCLIKGNSVQHCRTHAVNCSALLHPTQLYFQSNKWDKGESENKDKFSI